MSQRKQQQKPVTPASAKPKPELVQPTPETTEDPDWVNETPDNATYSMTMWDVGGSAEQEFYMTREEFIRLKRWLAALRGYDLRSPVDSTTADILRGKSEGERKAAALNIAQEEIQMVRDVEQVSHALCTNLLCRLRLGAKVEPGMWELEDDGSEIESYDARTCGGYKDGLDIRPVLEEKTSAAVA